MILFWIVNIFGGFLVALWSNHFFYIIFLFLSWMIQSVYAVLTDAGDEVIEPVLGKQRVLQTPEVELQHSSHRINVMVAFLVNQRIVTCMRGRREILKYKFAGVLITWQSSYLPVDLSPLSNEFLMSLTSTCDPDTRNMPWCWRPVGNSRGMEVAHSHSLSLADLSQMLRNKYWHKL